MINIKNNTILKEKTSLVGPIIAGIIITICLLGIIIPRATNADFANTTNASYLVKNTSWVMKVAKTVKVVATAYSSTEDQTDDTPFITASGKYVKDGIIASNLLPFGTKIKIPELYGNKVFTVEDRMNAKKGKYQIDIWMPDRTLAVNFGAKIAEMQILSN